MTMLVTFSWRFLVILAPERTMCSQSVRGDETPNTGVGSHEGASDQLGMHTEKNTGKVRIILWDNYKLSAPCAREPRNVGDDFIRRWRDHAETSLKRRASKRGSLRCRSAWRNCSTANSSS